MPPNLRIVCSWVNNSTHSLIVNARNSRAGLTSIRSTSRTGLATIAPYRTAKPIGPAMTVRQFFAVDALKCCLIDAITLSTSGVVTSASRNSRNDDRDSSRNFLTEADSAAKRLGADGNHLWTAFGPTNVAIHRVSTAMELGDVQVAVDLGPRVDTAAMPTERRVRHSLEVARALSTWNHRDEALSTMLDAEQLAPKQVRYHFISRNSCRPGSAHSAASPASSSPTSPTASTSPGQPRALQSLP